MTDARYPEAWLNDRRIIRLSDAAHRLHVTALAWCASNRTDGFLDQLDLKLIHGTDPRHASELVDADLWQGGRDGFQIIDFHKTQTTRAQLEGLDYKRHLDRERKARQRARERGEDDHSPAPMSRVTSGVTSDVTHRQGKDRTGKAVTESQENNGIEDTQNLRLPSSQPPPQPPTSRYEEGDLDDPDALFRQRRSA